MVHYRKGFKAHNSHVYLQELLEKIEWTLYVDIFHRHLTEYQFDTKLF